MNQNNSVKFFLFFLMTAFLLKASDQITLSGGTLEKIESIENATELIGITLNSDSNIALRKVFELSAKNSEFNSLKLLESATLFCGRNLYVHEDIIINMNACLNINTFVQCDGALRLSSGSALVFHLYNKNGLKAKSMNVESGKASPLIQLLFKDRDSSLRVLHSQMPLIDISDSLEATSPITISICRKPLSIPSGKYPLIKANKINTNQFNLDFNNRAALDVELSAEQKALHHLEFDETTVWLVVNEE